MARLTPKGADDYAVSDEKGNKVSNTASESQRAAKERGLGCVWLKVDTLRAVYQSEQRQALFPPNYHITLSM